MDEIKSMLAKGLPVRLAYVDPVKNHDKFYQVEMKLDIIAGGWVVETSWGRQGKTPQSKTIQCGDEVIALRKAQEILGQKIRGGYSLQAQPEKEIAQRLTQLQITRKEARRLDRTRTEKARERSELLYNLSTVTRAMHRLASTRYRAMATAEGLIDESMMERFETTDDGKLVREVWGRMYEPTAERSDLVETSETSAVRSAVHEALDALPEWQKIQDRCRRDVTLSTVTARHMAEHVLRDIIEEFPEPDRTPGEPGPPGEDGDDGPPTPEISDQAKAEMRAVLARGLQEAHEEIDKAEAAMDFAWGREAGDLSQDASPEEALDLAHLLSMNRDMRDLIERVGRMMRSFRATEADMYGTTGTKPFSVTPDNDIRRLLPSERLGLSHPDLMYRTLYRYTTRQTLCYDVRGREPKEAGPFIVLLDKSGSMSGEPMLQAKAFAIASMMLASSEGREVSLIAFDGTTHKVELGMTTPGERVRTIRDVGSIQGSGGTDFDNALQEASIRLQGGPEGLDVLIISDGDDHIKRDWTDLSNRAGIHYIHIGTMSPNRKLEDLATQTLRTRGGFDEDGLAAMAVGAARR